ncbi:hypothetical protein OAH31_01015 [Pontimonas sp.]|nr:hypothetical protein [Pontimonas sp.]MDB4607065.1 hypothetical protein [Pontimonas sp.]
MSKTPLSSSFDSAESTKSSKKGWLGLGAVAFFGLASAGSVFAASVSINSGSDISFTQGSEVIAACDSGIGASLDANFNGTDFGLSGITLTDVDSGCAGEAIALHLYDGTTKMLTVTGTLDSGLSDDSTVSIANEDASNLFIRAETSVAVASSINAWSSNVTGNVVVTFDSGTAITMAADADNLVIEIG